jgi:hypothetical protein
MKIQPKFEKLRGGSGLLGAFRYFGSKRWKFSPRWGQAIGPRVDETIDFHPKCLLAKRAARERVAAHHTHVSSGGEMEEKAITHDSLMQASAGPARA